MVLIAIFWALFDQGGSTWVLQAKRMDRDFLGIEWLPAQIQALNPILILAFVGTAGALVASEIARRNDSTLTYRYPVLVASSFGLLHGFGFASVLREVGLPPTELPTALLFFNVGVEIGQVAFVLVIFGCVRAVRLASRLAGHQTSALALGGGRTGLVTAYSIGTIGSFWTLERVLAFWG